jgi:GNAT superfamily N-acetyltransferase
MSGRSPRNLAPFEPADIEFRPMGRGDVAIGLELCRLAGWDQVRRDWDWFVSPENAHASMAQTKTGDVVGTVATVRYGTQFGWIGMLLVHPEAQGRGVGAVLLGHATAELSDVSSIRLDATPAGHFLYRKHGFVDESPLKRMEAVPNVAEQSTDTGAEPLSRAALADVCALDREVFGAPRADLLEWMLEGAPEYGFLIRGDGRVRGYLLGRHGHAFEHLGPIVADDAHLAVQLTRTCLARHAGRPFVIDSASEAPEWRQFLDEAGFREQRPYIRMFRGGRRMLGIQREEFAILGPEFG